MNCYMPKDNGKLDFSVYDPFKILTETFHLNICTLFSDRHSSFCRVQMLKLVKAHRCISSLLESYVNFWD